MTPEKIVVTITGLILIGFIYWFFFGKKDDMQHTEHHEHHH
jgi:plastocyanin domain-containing protein